MPDASRARVLALAGVVGPAAFTLAALVSAPMESGYSHVHQFVSELAAEGSGGRVVMTIGFLTLGVSMLVFAWSFRVLRPALSAVALIIALSGAGTLMAGTFSCDRGCPATGDNSTHQDLHNVSSVLTFSSWIIAPLFVGVQLRRTRYGKASLALAGVALVASLVLLSFKNRMPDDPVGLLQRIVLVTLFSWFVVTTLELRRVTPEPARA